MKRVGIITLNGYFNYGNRLQNYALEMTLKKMGNEVQTIWLDRNTSIQNIKEAFFEAKRRVINNNNFNKNKKREEIFRAFSNKYLNETKKKYSINKNLSVLNNNYDKFIVGSDQVWNPHMNRCSSAYFLQFAEKQKRISYSASFGVSSFNSRTEEVYSRWLKDISNISVREEEGVRIVERLAKKKVEVLVDPTMLLSKEEWLDIAAPAKSKPNKKYLLTYFLGAIPKQYHSQMKKIAEKRNLEMVNIGDPEEQSFYETGPGEFIDYINDSEIFCTDSFHGVVFSILLQKPFIIYERQGPKSMYARIRTIIDMFNLQSREYINIRNLDEMFDIDYSSSIDVINKEKERALNFLATALNDE